jgi:Asp-tRNA(Asn)/Glu-tRNA(Gln) amidotransferase A subunit family amidase
MVRYFPPPKLAIANLNLGGGSVRDPAIANGIYGLRPTHDEKQELGSRIPFP